MPISPNPEKTAAPVRYRRYKAVVDQLVERSDFVLADIHEACHGERQGFVTRLVNELVQAAGLFVRTIQRGKPIVGTKAEASFPQVAGLTKSYAARRSRNLPFKIVRANASSQRGWRICAWPSCWPS